MKSKSIFLAGHRGMVGSAVLNCLQDNGYENVITRTRGELDLINQAQVNSFFAKERPDAVIICAAKVGGILANNTLRADFIYQNLQIASNLNTCLKQIQCSKTNQSWQFMHISSRCKNTDCRRKSFNRCTRKNKRTICYCQNSSNQIV